MSDSAEQAPVLVVEDDADCRVMLATLLTFAGYRVLTASNGAEALTVARRHHPCLILLDFMMPIMDGREFRAQQRLDSSLKDVPVVLVSARHDAEEVAALLEVTAIVEKPVVHEELLRTVREYCPPEHRPA
jgi:CheY-like chemotaxis protein